MPTDVIISDASGVTEQNATSDGGGPYTGISDTQLMAGNPTTNFVGSNDLRVYDDTSASQETFAIMSFAAGLDNITGPVTVSSATIYLNILGNAGDASLTVNVHEVIPAMVYAEATWNIYSTGNNWDTAGAKTSGTDYDATVLATASVSGTPTYWTSFSGAGLAQAVEDYINGVKSKLDLILRWGGSPTLPTRRSWVSESSPFYPSQHPELVVVYSSATPAVTATFANNYGVSQPNLSAIQWAWFDQDIGALSAPTAQGSVETTDGSGAFSVDVTGTALTSGQTGTLVLYDSSGGKYGAYRAVIGSNGTLRFANPGIGGSFYFDAQTTTIGVIASPPMGPLR